MLDEYACQTQQIMADSDRRNHLQWFWKRWFQRFNDNQSSHGPRTTAKQNRFNCKAMIYLLESAWYYSVGDV